MIHFCPYCDKELSEEKGELAHGCLNCHYDPRVDKIKELSKKLAIAVNALEKIDVLLSAFEINASVVTVSEDNLGYVQCILHEALEKINR